MQHTVSQSDPRQFTIGSLFFWTAFVGIALLIFTHTNELTFLFVPIALLGLLFSIKRISANMFAISVLGWTVIAVLSPAITTQRYGHPSRCHCSNQIRQLSLALLNYESAYGEFPPAYTVDEDGNRLHSWRTLILPYIEENDRYQKIDLKLPWDHPSNRPLALPTPLAFRCPKESMNVDDGTTQYVGIIGSGLMWKENGIATKLKDVTDGTSNSIGIIELNNHRVPWMSPRRYALQRILETAQTGSQTAFGSSFGRCQRSPR